ncbi:MAG TPA: hypothetical protein VG797_02840 [Phycisphaerales bacterium]|nr:hypothetical protein [Phycisphaerales bacterium]
MRQGLYALAATAGIAATAGSTNAAIYFTFDDPSAALEVQYVAPTGPADTGDLTYNTSIPVDFVVDATDEGALDAVTFQAIFSTATTVGAVTQVGASTYTAPISGQFEFRRADNNQLILSGMYNGATMFITSIVGSLLADGTVDGGSLFYSPGPALTSALAGVGYALPGFNLAQAMDAVWTLTAITRVQLIQFGGEGPRFLDSFNANAAFTGTVRVPTPGSIALVGLAGLSLAGRRKRS